MKESTLKKAMREIAKRGGKSTSKAKRKASAENLKTARQNRWPKRS